MLIIVKQYIFTQLIALYLYHEQKNTMGIGCFYRRGNVGANSRSGVLD